VEYTNTTKLIYKVGLTIRNRRACTTIERREEVYERRRELYSLQFHGGGGGV